MPSQSHDNTPATVPVKAARGGLPTRFSRNALSNYGNAIVSMVLAIVVTPVLVRGLGKDAYGTLAIVTSSVLYFNLLQFGFGRATIKFVAEARALGDADRVKRVVSTAITALSIPGAALLLAAPGIGFAVPAIFKVDPDLRTAAIIVTILSAIDLAVAIPADTLGATLVGYQRYDFLNATVVASALGQAVAWTVLIALGHGLVAIGVATVAFSLAAQVLRYRLVGRLIGGSPFKRQQVDRSLIGPITSFSGWIAVNEVANTIIARVDVVVVGLIVGVPQAAVYAVGQKLGALTGRFTDPVTAMFYPHASELAAQGDREALRATIITGIRISVAVSLPLTAVLAVLASPLVKAWVGSGFDSASWVVVFLGLSAFGYSIDRIGVYVLRGLGIVKFPAGIALVEAAVNLGLSVALGIKIGLVGVAVGTFVAHMVTSFAITMPYVARRVGIPLRSIAWVIVRSYAVPAALQVLTGFALLYVGIHGLGEVIAAALAMLAVFVLSCLVFAVSRSERRILFARVLRMRGVSFAS